MSEIKATENFYDYGSAYTQGTHVNCSGIGYVE